MDPPARCRPRCPRIDEPREDLEHGERWVIVLRDAGGSEQPVGRRVAGCLKAMLRGWKLRCVEVSETDLHNQLAASRAEVLELRAEVDRLRRRLGRQVQAPTLAAREQSSGLTRRHANK